MDNRQLSGRIATGFSDLDDLLYGGLPEKYAVALASSPGDERDLLIRKFLGAGLDEKQIIFYISPNPGPAMRYLDESRTSLYLFICNPRSDVIAPNLPNVYKLKGVENLTEIDITLTKAYRTLDNTQRNPRRACIEIISDVLLQHHAVIARKWLSGLLADLKANGFTTLAIVNTSMHSAEEVQAVLGLFDGEIRISENESHERIQKTMRIRKMCNQEYKENEITLTKEKLLVDTKSRKMDSNKQGVTSSRRKEDLLLSTHETQLLNENKFKIASSVPEAKKHKSEKQESKVSICAMCSKQIESQPLLVTINNKLYTFDCPECVRTFKKLKRVYGDTFS
jgi:KaiC/GvpD/RAD55 family RecA-like ATPase